MNDNIILSAFLFLSIACSGQVIDSAKIGSGGGFTGEVMIFKIVNRNIVKGRGIAKIKYLEKAKLTCSDARKINTGLKGILSSGVEFDFPYNTYKFIEIYSKGKKTRITWGDPSQELPKDIRENYDQINTILNKLKFKPNE